MTTAVADKVSSSIIVSLQRHSLSKVWGDISGDEAIEFARGFENEVDEMGLDIHTLDGMVLDGWQRYIQFCRLGITPRFIEYTGSDPVAFVIRRNAHRRHLSAGQQALAIKDARTYSGVKLNGGGQEIEDLAEEAEVSSRTMMRALRADKAGLGDMVRNGQLRVDLAADIAAHEDIARDLKGGDITVEDAVSEVKARKPLSRADKLDAELSLMRREMERTLQKIDRLEDENNFLRSLNDDDDGERVRETFGGQRRMISTLRDSTHQWMEHYRRIMRSRDYWRSNARRMGYHPSARDAVEVDRMDVLEREVDGAMASTTEYLDSVLDFLDKNEPPPIVLKSGSAVSSAPPAPSPGSGPAGAYTGEGAIVDVVEKVPSAEEMSDPEDDLWLYNMDLNDPRTLERMMDRESSDGPSEDMDDGFDNIDDIYAEDDSYGEEEFEEASDGPSEASGYGQMRMGGEMGEVRRPHGHERPNGYRPLGSDSSRQSGRRGSSGKTD